MHAFPHRKSDPGTPTVTGAPQPVTRSTQTLRALPSKRLHMRGGISRTPSGRLTFHMHDKTVDCGTIRPHRTAVETPGIARKAERPAGIEPSLRTATQFQPAPFDQSAPHSPFYDLLRIPSVPICGFKSCLMANKSFALRNSTCSSAGAIRDTCRAGSSAARRRRPGRVPCGEQVAQLAPATSERAVCNVMFGSSLGSGGRCCSVLRAGEEREAARQGFISSLSVVAVPRLSCTLDLNLG